MSGSLLVKPDLSSAASQVHRITPQSAGWRYVGFEVFDLTPGRPLERRVEGREQCLVLLSGRAAVTVEGRDFGTIGLRGSPFEGKPFAVYVPSGATVSVTPATDCELAVCSAPGKGDLSPRLIRPEEVGEEVRGIGTNTRYVRNVLPATAPAECLQVVEVVTPGGHWSSYPPHKHEVHNPPQEVDLDEIYYYRANHPNAFALQRLYSSDGKRDIVINARDNDVVLVRDGFHPVVAGPGYDIYYLNFLAGSARALSVTEDSDHVWLKSTWKEIDPRLPVVALTENKS